ncbi:hypothetical protein MKZ24_21665 [Paenibacillus sp. FSL R7-0297]
MKVLVELVVLVAYWWSWGIGNTGVLEVLVVLEMLVVLELFD